MHAPFPRMGHWTETHAHTHSLDGHLGRHALRLQSERWPTRRLVQYQSKARNKELSHPQSRSQLQQERNPTQPYASFDILHPLRCGCLV